MPTFSVTYEIVTDESSKHGDYAEAGFLLKDTRSLREAIDLLGCAIEADSSPISLDRPPIWFRSEFETDYRTGTSESRSLHLSGVTPSSAMRIARLLGIRGA